jgi:hypothetical protein
MKENECFYSTEEEAYKIITNYNKYIGETVAFEKQRWTLKGFRVVRADNIFIIKAELFIQPSMYIDVLLEELQLD